MSARRLAVALVLAMGLAACSPPRTGTTEQEVVFFSPPSYDFGSWPVGQQAPMPVQVVVGVAAAIDEYHLITNIYESCSDFALDLSPITFPATIYRDCSAGCVTESQSFFVNFTPSVAGPQSCTITVAMDDGNEVFTVNGTGEPPPYALTLLTPLPAAMAFGDVVVNQTSAALPITVRSDGSQPITIDVAAIVGPSTGTFVITNGGAAVVNPGAEHTIMVQCLPQASGAVNEVFRIDSNAPDTPLDIGVSCNGVVSDLVINPSPARMSELLVGQSTFIDLTLSNVGSATLNIDTVTVTPPFVLDSISQLTIPGSGTISARVSLTPSAANADSDVNGTFTVNYDGSQSRGIEIIAPVRSADVSVNPGGVVDFGTVCGGQTARRLFAAVNLGTGYMELASASIDGTGFSLSLQPASYPAPLTARAGNTVAFEVTAAPPLGESTGTLDLTPTVSAIPTTTVTLRATGQAGGIAATPTSIEVDSVYVGESSGARSVRLTNCESSALSVTRVEITGPEADEFTVLSDFDVPDSIPAFVSATWLVELRPDYSGDKNATLVITHANGVTSIPLSGQGVDLLDEDEPGRGTYYACNAGDGAGLLPLLLALVALFTRRSYRSA